MDKSFKTKTSLRKTADVSLKPIDLIHPNEKSNLPGYGGYTSQLKFNCGHTYGYHTDKLSKGYTANEKHLRTRSYDSYTPPLVQKLQIIEDGGASDRKYTENMVPGYTGFVPQHSFKYGKTYREGTEDAIKDFAYHNYKQRLHTSILKDATTPRLVSNSKFSKSDGHPGFNIKHAYAYNARLFDDKRPFTEPPIPGYMGYVPKHEEHKLGGRYGFWTRNAYLDAAGGLDLAESRAFHHRANADNMLRTRVQSSPDFDAQGKPRRFGAIYNAKLGMVPHYTGYIPQHRFNIAGTYGDLSRDLPVCYDTMGYASGLYRTTGPSSDRTVIPVRI